MSVFTRPDSKPETGVAPASASPVAPPKPETATVVQAEPKPRPVAAPVTSLAPQSSGGASIISKALKITGQLESSEDIQIDGEVEGDVRAVTVRVGNNAKVKGAVYGDQVELAGTVDGKIEAKKVVLTATARMSGDVIHQDITIQSGAFIDGHCKPEYGKSDRKVIPVHKAS